ncbi:DNA recombination protein RmuC [Actinoplanes utahensis]|uniref:DNA recombinase n=1 Tax=Actinoplanes utahensis TaxID=1869 RepID=A0A0A6UBL3_ACTUT|nr:DNA recombination protein RmuC [Actinoplanes utahensis]KHD72846.1 DNA recombinase [Actinoplanes utahensis]
MTFSTLAVVLACLAAGAAAGWLAARARAATDIARLEATLEAARDGEQRLEQSLRALSYEATAQSQEAVARAVAPLHDTLLRYEQRVAQLEHDRVDAYAELREQVRSMGAVSGELRTETRQLVAALRAPQVRGRWGEHQLRRIVEAAGLLEHCDFAEQVTAATDEQGVRPDLVVRLYGGRTVVVDAKAPLEGYLSAMEARDEHTRDGHLDQHARHLRMHVDALSAKKYWSAFESTPDFVVLFVPADPFLDAALQRDPALMEHAFRRNIVLATPATLIAMLRTVAYSWRQEALTRNAAAVHGLARELYARLSTLGDHVDKLGTSLSGAVTAYNRAVGSLESRVLVSARKLAEMGVSDEELLPPVQVEIAPRQPQAPEFS